MRPPAETGGAHASTGRHNGASRSGRAATGGSDPVIPPRPGPAPRIQAAERGYHGAALPVKEWANRSVLTHK